jgi:peptide/nickel transport system substrate-binding protein
MSSKQLIGGLVVAAVAVGAMFALDGCGGGADEGGTTAAAPPEESGAYDPKRDPLVNTAKLIQPHDPAQCAEDEYLYAVIDGNPETLNPIFGTSTYEFRVTGTLFDGPWSFNAKMEFFVQDYWVEKLDVSTDQTEWTVKLRANLKWHDGHPLTAHDIVFSWQNILDERVPCPAQRPGTDEIVECKALDDHTVFFRCKQPSPTNKWNVFFSIIPKHIYEKEKEQDPSLRNNAYYSERNRNPVGCGPYKFVEWIENDKIVVERWDEFPGPKPHFKRIIFRIIPDDKVTFLRFEAGEVDEMVLTKEQFAVDTNKSEKFRQRGAKAMGDQWSFSYIAWSQNGQNPFFGDRRVRHAMSHAINIPKIIERLFYNLAEQAYGMYHPDSWMFSPDITRIPFDPERARALLDEAGWRVSDQDGWRYKDGRKFSFTLMYGSGNSVVEQIASAVQADLKRIGVEMNTNPIEWAAFSEKTRNGEFEASMAAWGTGTDPDTNYNLWHSTQYKVGRNYVAYKNPRVDELFELGRKEFDAAKRAKIYQEIGKLVYDDQPYTFLVNSKLTWGFSNRIRGVTFSPRGVWNFDPAEKAWWVHKSEQAHNLR